MRTSLFDPPSIEHPIVDELQSTSAWLDTRQVLHDAVIVDLDTGTASGRGRHGLSGETVLRCAVQSERNSGQTRSDIVFGSGN